MKKILLATAAIFSIMLLPAQGIYQLWGVRHVGGNDELGSIFSTDASGNNFQSRFQIKAINPGGNPKYAAPVEYNGKFYGVTSTGGKFDKGVIFEFDPVTNIYTRKIDFDGINGGLPLGSLMLFDNKFYGMTSGSNIDAAVIFEWDPATNIYNKKIDFSNTDGTSPVGSLELMGNKFYGMTSGGGTFSAGEIFEWDPASNVYIKKMDFDTSGSNGYGPCSNLTLSNGKFYGMTTSGGNSGNGGIIFEWDPVTNIYQAKLNFDNNGYAPKGSLSLVGDKFYGVTSLGGTNNFGSLFEWDPIANIYIKKIDLSSGSGNNFLGSLTPAGGKLFGMMSNGGTFNTGIIFEWDTATNIFTKKIDLNDTLGNSPSGSLTWSDGKFYGLMDAGGAISNHTRGEPGKGLIFEWDTATNIYTKRIEFDKREAGTYPTKSLTYYNGKLYGMASGGGKNNAGVIFELDPATNLYSKKIDLHDIGGQFPIGNLLLQNGKFYGMTPFDSSGRLDGIIFEWDPLTGVCTKKVDLDSSGSNPGKNPDGGLTAFNGKFYGMTRLGGATYNGIIFEWDPATNVCTKKIDFDELNGSEPLGSLTLYNGKLYGMTFEGGIYGLVGGGVIFEWDPVTNVYTKKIDLGGTMGEQPEGSLTLYNGKFYGTTHGGGANSSGVIFEWDPATNIYIKKMDFGGDTSIYWYVHGHYPYGSLTMSNGKFYGMTDEGGDSINRYGVIFEWDPGTNVYIKKKDLTDNEYGWFERAQDLILAPAPLAARSQGSCASFPDVTIDNKNNNVWVPITDTLGNAVAEINANGNNLGSINSYMYANSGPVREDSAKRLYLDMNLTITPQFQPASPVDIRVYIKNAEYTLLKNAVNSNSQPSGISSINDIGIFKSRDNNCLSAIQDIAGPVSTTGVLWQNDYVISASIPSFSSFYFANKNLTALPLSLLEFNGRLLNKNVLLSWKTDNEQNIARFEIERSLDGNNYTLSGTEASAGTPGIHTYSFTDTKTSTFGKAVIYYRLKQTDIDGRFTYSRIVIISIENDNGCLFFPNPVTDKATLIITINQPQEVNTRIIDNTGKTVKQLQWNLPAGSTSLPIDVSKLAKGMYYLELKGRTINEHKQFSRQ